MVFIFKDRLSKLHLLFICVLIFVIIIFLVWFRLLVCWFEKRRLFLSIFKHMLVMSWLFVIFEREFEMAKSWGFKFCFDFLLEFNKFLFDFRIYVSLFELFFWFDDVFSINSSLIRPAYECYWVIWGKCLFFAWSNWVFSRGKATFAIDFRSCKRAFEVSLSSSILWLFACVWTIRLLSLFKNSKTFNFLFVFQKFLWLSRASIWPTFSILL